MSTTLEESDVAPPPTLPREVSRYRLGPRDFRQFVYLAAAFVLVVFLGLYAFALVFNEVTIYGWLFAAGFVAFRHGFIQYRNRLAVSGTATAKSSSAAIGLSELTGRGSAEHPGTAPVSKAACLFWSIEVHQWQKRGKRRGWNSKLRNSFGVETLELEDASGRILVWTRGAELIHVKQVWKSEDGDPPEAGLRLVEATGLKWPERSSGYPMKITEQRILADAPLYVMGTLAERRQIPETPRSFLPRVLGRWAEMAPRLDDQSFAAAFRFASQGARRWLARDLQPVFPRWSPPAVDPHHVVVWEGDQGRPFIISGLLEPEAMKALSRRAWAYILGGAAAMAGTIFAGVSKLTDLMR